MAAVQAVVDVAGGKVNMCSFARGRYDIVLDMNVPSQEMMMGAMAMVKASGSISDAIYIELIDGDPVWGGRQINCGCLRAS